MDDYIINKVNRILTFNCGNHFHGEDVILENTTQVYIRLLGLPRVDIDFTLARSTANYSICFYVEQPKYCGLNETKNFSSLILNFISVNRIDHSTCIDICSTSVQSQNNLVIRHKCTNKESKLILLKRTELREYRRGNVHLDYSFKQSGFLNEREKQFSDRLAGAEQQQQQQKLRKSNKFIDL